MVRLGLIIGAVGTLAVLAVLALVGVFESDEDGGRSSLSGVSPAVGQAEGSVINRIYARTSPGSVFIQARIVQ